jgi:predicted nuclease with TOPRIM domain
MRISKVKLETKEAGYKTMKEFYNVKLREANNDVQMKILDLESEKEDNENLKRKNINLQSRLTDYENRIHKYQQDIRNLEESKQQLSDEKSGLEKKNQKLENAHSEQTLKITKLESENHDLKEKCNQHEKLNK